MADPSSDQDFDSAAFRTRARQAKIAARLALPASDHTHASGLIEAHLAALLTNRPPSNIAFCWPLSKEFDCRPLVSRLLTVGWHACQPVVVTVAAPMVFRTWRPDSPMTTDRYGIPIPDTESVAAPNVILLPLVAFDEQGYRLGYGGGYFDRTLANLTPRPLTIGVGFELARLDTVRPLAHDIPLDLIATEMGIRRIGLGKHSE